MVKYVLFNYLIDESIRITVIAISSHQYKYEEHKNHVVFFNCEVTKCIKT